MQTLFVQQQQQQYSEDEYYKNLTQKYQVQLSYEADLANCPEIEPYRMNLLAVSHINKCLFVGSGYSIKCYKIAENGSIDFKQNYELLQVQNQGQNMINQLKLAYFKNREILVTVDMVGKITVFNVNNLKQQPLSLDNRFENIQDCSTWSLDALLLEGCALLACGSNAHKISVWDLTHIYNLQDYQLGLADKPERKVIEGIHHNVPCIKFSPCGTFLAAVSIDQTVRIYRVSDCEQIAQSEFKDWGWSVNWALKQNVINYNISIQDIQYTNVINSTVSSHNQTLNKLQKYLLICSTTHDFHLIDPVPLLEDELKNNQQQTRAILMQQVHSINFGLKKNHKYGSIARYSLVHFDQEFNLAVATPQHTPLVDCFELIFDISTKQFKMQRTNIHLRDQITGYIIGSSLLSKPSSSPFCKTASLFILNKLKKIHLFQIQKLIQSNSKELNEVADYSEICI
ncbi:hypothetical protein ABPG72_018108 [Tetrahymena utriculariae]